MIMKIILRRILILVILASFIPSCNLFEDCKTCRLVKDDHGVITKGAGIPTCGEALKERESEEPVTIDGVTTYWECY